MARIVSFVVLVAILLVAAGLFFRVMAGFLLPMFMAVLLVIMFGPLHLWILGRCKGHDRLAAGLTTAAILLIVLLPLLAVMVPAYFEGKAIYDALVDGESETAQEADPKAALKTAPKAGLAKPEVPEPEVPEPEVPEEEAAENDLKSWAVDGLVKLGKQVGLELEPADVELTVTEKLTEWGTPVALSTTQYIVSFLVGFFIMIISLYYFLVDGPAMIRTVMRLSPLDDKYEQQLVDQFADLTRAVVIATLLSALAQGILAGIGFAIAGLGSVFLLMLLAMLLSLVPFVGAAAVWIPACLWLYFQGNTTSAIVLAIYCASVVSMADNVIKPLVLHGRSNLHPLLALLSVLGGVQALGPIGIFVGPMVVAFLQTLLNMLQMELSSMSNGNSAAVDSA